MEFVSFPDIIPSSMDFTPPRFAVGSQVSIGGVSSRRKFSNKQYDGRLAVEFRNIPNSTCAQVLLVCIQSKGLAPIAFQPSFFRGAGNDLKLFLDCSAYPGLLWYFLEDSPPRINRVEGAAEISNLSLELAARLLPGFDGSLQPVLPPGPPPIDGGGGGGGGGGYGVLSVGAQAPIVSSGGINPIISITPATPSAAGSLSAADKTKLDGIQSGAQVNVPTDLGYVSSERLLESSTGTDVILPLVSSTIAGLAPASGGGITKFLRADGTWAQPPGSGSTDLDYTPSTRLLTSSSGTDVILPLFSPVDPGLVPFSGGGTATFLRADGTWAAPPGVTNLSYVPSTRLLESSSGSDVTLPLVTNANAGLAPASGGGTSNFLRADGNWAAPPSGGSTPTTLTYTTASLTAGEVEDFTLTTYDLFQFLSFTSSTPSWIRVYGTSAARTLDTRTSPGGSVPQAGTEFYAELVTVSSPQTIRLSPVPLVQATGNQVFIRIKNMDTVIRQISITLSALSTDI